MNSSPFSRLEVQNDPVTAMRNVVQHMFNNERMEWHADGKPQGHIFSALSVLAVEACKPADAGKKALNLSPNGRNALDRVLEYSYPVEHRRWLEAGRPASHVFVDVLVIGRDQLQHKAKLVEQTPVVESESDTNSAALRGNLASPVVEELVAAGHQDRPEMGE